MLQNEMFQRKETSNGMTIWTVRMNAGYRAMKFDCFMEPTIERASNDVIEEVILRPVDGNVWYQEHPYEHGYLDKLTITPDGCAISGWTPVKPYPPEYLTEKKRTY